MRNLKGDMVSLAAHILDSKAGHFDPSKFKDRYENALKTLVRRKAKGKAIEPPKDKPEESNVINLMDALRASLKGEAKKPPAQSAPERREAKKPAAASTPARGASKKKATR